LSHPACLEQIAIEFAKGKQPPGALASPGSKSQLYRCHLLARTKGPPFPPHPCFCSRTQQKSCCHLLARTERENRSRNIPHVKAATNPVKFPTSHHKKEALTSPLVVGKSPSRKQSHGSRVEKKSAGTGDQSNNLHSTSTFSSEPELTRSYCIWATQTRTQKKKVPLSAARRNLIFHARKKKPTRNPTKFTRRSRPPALSSSTTHDTATQTHRYYYKHQSTTYAHEKNLRPDEAREARRDTYPGTAASSLRRGPPAAVEPCTARHPLPPRA